MTSPTVATRRPTAEEFLLSWRFVVLAAVVFGLFIFGFATKGTFDPWTIGTFLPGHFFSAQADAMLDGRLWVEPSQIPDECFFVEGRCYGYFGLPPSIVRLPLVVLFGVEHSEMTAVFLAVGAGVALWAALDLCRRVLLRECPRATWHTAGYMAVAAVVLGPGGALVLVTDAYVYQEAIMWSVASTMVGVNLFWRWWTERADRQFIGATVAFVIAAGSRPSAALVGVVLAVVVVAHLWLTGRLTRRALLGAAAMALLPGVLMVAVFWAKFDAPLPPEKGYQALDYEFIQRVIANNDGEFGTSVRFVPTAALSYLRPDAFRVDADWPWVRFRFGRPYGPEPMERITYLPPLATDSISVERTTSVTDVMPLPLVATVAATGALLVRRRHRIELAILAALVTVPLVMMTTQTIASRYLGDFFPLLAGCALGSALGQGLDVAAL